MFFRTPFILPWLYPELVWRIPTHQKKIFLTFDDGPVPGPTEFVLDTLKKFNARATFFCIGDNVRKHQQLFQKIIDEDHSIGNHTFNHIKGWNCSVKEYLDNIELCSKQFLQASIQFPASSIQHPASSFQHPASSTTLLFRPPYGRIKRKQIKALNDYKIIMWDVLTHDYLNQYTPERCLAGSIGATRPGSIVVFHDSIKAERNLTFALPRYLEFFFDKGFSFEAI